MASKGCSPPNRRYKSQIRGDASGEPSDFTGLTRRRNSHLSLALVRHFFVRNVGLEGTQRAGDQRDWAPFL